MGRRVIAPICAQSGFESGHEVLLLEGPSAKPSGSVCTPIYFSTIKKLPDDDVKAEKCWKKETTKFSNLN